MALAKGGPGARKIRWGVTTCVPRQGNLKKK